ASSSTSAWKRTFIASSAESQSEVRTAARRGAGSLFPDHHSSSTSPETPAVKRATDATSPANVPTWSSVFEKWIAPAVERRPPVGLNPTVPEYAPGRIVEPFVCVPIAPGITPAATAAAEPIDDPPGVRPRSYGLRVGPGVRNA